MLCLCISLCGCTIYEDTDSYYTKEGVELAENTAVAEKIDKLFGTDKSGALTKEQRAYLDTDFEKVENINFIQQSNGREVEVYASKLLKGAYVYSDGEWIHYKSPRNTRPEECEELYDKLSNTAFEILGYSNGEDNTTAIECDNREYNVLDFYGETPFSINYPDVDVELENMPIKVIVYAKDGKAERVELITASSSYIGRLSEQNIAEVAELFSTLGLGDESESLATELAESLDKASYSRTDGAMTVQSSRDVSRGKKFVYSVLKISFE